MKYKDNTMSIEDYKKKALEEQKHIDELNQLQKDADLWERKAAESAKEVFALEAELKKKKNVSLRAFIKQKSKQEELVLTEKDDKISFLIKGCEKEKLYFEFTFAEKENKFEILKNARVIKTIIFKYVYKDYSILPNVEYLYTSNEQDKLIKDKKSRIEIAKKQIDQDKAKKEFIINNDLFIKIKEINLKCNKLYTDDEFWEEIFKIQI